MLLSCCLPACSVWLAGTYPSTTPLCTDSGGYGGKPLISRPLNLPARIAEKQSGVMYSPPRLASLSLFMCVHLYYCVVGTAAGAAMACSSTCDNRGGPGLQSWIGKYDSVSKSNYAVAGHAHS